MEKLLLEACLEVMKTDALVGIQDMGAAGLTSSSCEMGARGGAGVELGVAGRQENRLATELDPGPPRREHRPDGSAASRITRPVVGHAVPSPHIFAHAGCACERANSRLI